MTRVEGFFAKSVEQLAARCSNSAGADAHLQFLVNILLRRRTRRTSRRRGSGMAVCRSRGSGTSRSWSPTQPAGTSRASSVRLQTTDEQRPSARMTSGPRHVAQSSQADAEVLQRPASKALVYLPPQVPRTCAKQKLMVPSAGRRLSSRRHQNSKRSGHDPAEPARWWEGAGPSKVGRSYYHQRVAQPTPGTTVSGKKRSSRQTPSLRQRPFPPPPSHPQRLQLQVPRRRGRPFGRPRNGKVILSCRSTRPARSARPLFPAATR